MPFLFHVHIGGVEEITAEGAPKWANGMKHRWVPIRAFPESYPPILRAITLL
jgi:hypothetical protein